MVTTKAVAKVAAVATGLAMATSMLSLAPMAHAALTSSQVQSILSLLTSFGADSTTIANVQASLTGGTPSTTTTTTTTGGSCSFSKDLTIGSTGMEVTCLQQALIAGGFSVPAGATGYFGSQTRTAVAAWQKSKNIAPAVGYFGSISRAAYDLGGGSSTTTTTTGPSAGTGNGLKVSLAATSPNGSVLVQGQGIGDLGEFVFANPTSAPINVTGVTFKRIGVSNDSTLTNVYLYNAGTRITDSAGVSSGQFSWGDANGIFTVPAGMTYTVAVRSDIDGSAQGQQIGVSLVSVSSTGTLDSSVSFPVNSGYQTVSAANLATVNFTAAPSPTGSPSISPQNDYPVWQDTVSVSTNAVKLTSLKFTNLGSIDTQYVTNLRLYVDGVQVGSAISSIGSSRSFTFDLSSSPVLLSTQNHVVKVLANITGGASRTLQLSVQRSSDGMFVDNQLGQPVTPQYTGTTFGAVTTTAITINSVTGTTGVSVSINPASPTQSVAVGASNVKWASFDFLASGENVKVNDLWVSASSTASSGALALTGGLYNGKLFVNGVQVGSTKNIGSLTAGRVDFALGSSLILPAGQVTTVDIYGDAKDKAGTSFVTGTTVIAAIDTVASNAQGQSSLQSATVPGTKMSGNTITVTSSSLTATKYTGYGAQTIVAGSNSAKLGAFTLSTGSTEGVTVNTIGITLTTAAAASVTNLTLKDDATGAMLGNVITTPSGASNAFSVNVDVPASSSKTISVYANILSGANAGPITAQVDTNTSGTGDLTGSSASATLTNLQTITVGSGSLSVTRGAGDPTSNNVLAGASSVMVGEFNFSASNSAYTVNNLAILVPNSVATSVTNVTLSYKDINGATKTQTQPLAVNAAMANATATFTGLAMYVPMNDSSNLDVYIGTPTVASGATSGAGVVVTLDTGNTSTSIDNTFSATNSAGSSLTVVNSGTSIASNGTFYVRKSIPTFAVPAGQGGSIVPTNPIYRFSVTADPAGAIEWSRLTFTVATTSTTLTAVDLVDESTGTSLLDNNTSSASTTQTSITVDLTKNSSKAQYAQVAAGSTKTYDINGTMGAFGTGASITIKLAQDTGAPSANAAASTLTTNVVWSDRSVSPHVPPSLGVTSSSDFTNGSYLKNFTTNSVSYSK